VKAQVFTLSAQEALRLAIAKSLRSIYDDVEIQHHIYENDPRRIGQKYLDMLRASAIGVGTFTVEVEDQFGYWRYWDYLVSDVERADHFLRLPHEAKERIFPGVAIINRMVIVPQGMRDALDVPSDFVYLLKPLDLQGVLTVDFAAKNAVSDAVTRVGAEVRREIVSLARRQMATHRIPSPDFEYLSILLDVHIRFLRDLRDEIQTPSPRLTVEIASGPALLNRISPVEIEVANESKHPAGFVDIQVRAPFNGVYEPPTRYTDRLDFSSSATNRHTMAIEILPRTTPYCPLEVLFVFEESVDAITFPIPLIVDVDAQ
jgi:hypothetical protein